MGTSKIIWKLALISLLICTLTPPVVWAAQASSTNYQVSQVFFGSGGALNDCSANYCSKQSAGEVAVGHASSTNYQAQGGFNTDRQPYIQFQVSGTYINLGTLSPTTYQTANSTFTIQTYLAHGYTVINASPPPSNNSYTMKALAVPTASAVGTEQFGINLVANTSPTTFGANPSFVPDSSFSHGQVDADYSTPNEYKYAQGDTIALSNQSSSDTTFTISYLFNISNVTPGGQYTFNHVLVATSTY